VDYDEWKQREDERKGLHDLGNLFIWCFFLILAGILIAESV
jgi:hypothetical protein